jgi:hypothetical protein
VKDIFMANRKNLLDEFDLEVHWLRLGELTGDAELSCIDGRHRGHVLGAPGGDTGELILMLGTLEAITDEVFSPSRVEDILVGYLARLGRFYQHSDRDALVALEKTIRTKGRTEHEALVRALDAATSIDELLHAPPPEVRTRLAELLVMPRHVGCGHLRAMLEYTDEYGVRRALIEDTIRAFFRLLWNGNPQADFTILEGQHEETVIITFDTDQPVTADTLIPSVCASDEGPYLFANHQAARRYKRRIDLDVLGEAIDLGRFVGERADEQAQRDLLEQAEQLAERQAAATISHLAAHLPAYTVIYRGRQLAVDMIDSVT